MDNTNEEVCYKKFDRQKKSKAKIKDQGKDIVEEKGKDTAFMTEETMKANENN